jgi:hypothetical protein
MPQMIQMGLDEIHRVRPGRGKIYVENYIKVRQGQVQRQGYALI